MAAVKVLEKNGGPAHGGRRPAARGGEPARRESLDRPRHLRPELLEITSAYGALANQGAWMPTHRDPLRARRAAQAPRGEHPAEQAGRLAGAGLRDHPHAARDDRARHRACGQAPRAARSRPRPARPTTTRTRGSSATRRSWPPGSGSATTGRAAWARTRPARASRCRSGRVHGKALAGQPQEDFPIPERVVLVPVDLDPSSECVRPVTDGLRRGHRAGVACGPRRQASRSVAPPARRPHAASTWRPPVVGSRAGGAAVRSFRRRVRTPRPRHRPRPRAEDTSRCRASRRPSRTAHRRPARHRAAGLSPPRAGKPPRRPARPSRPAASRTRLELGDRHPDLLHRVAVADRHACRRPVSPLLGVAHRLHVHRHAVGRAHLVLAPVEAADRRGVVVDRVIQRSASSSRMACAVRHDLRRAS